MNVAVLRFPGSNCDLDAVSAVNSVPGLQGALVWHEDTEVLATYEAVVLPGGFSFGDYLRAGAIAARSPAITTVRDMASAGVPILGICNGFQILIEAGLLPGALLRNSGLRFVCKWTNIRVERDDTRFTRGTNEGDILRMPIAHGEGRYYASPFELESLERRRMIVFRYSDAAGATDAASNPTGTLSNIAGISNEDGNVVGLMPHPERAVDPILGPWGTSDGLTLFRSLLEGRVRRRGTDREALLAR